MSHVVTRIAPSPTGNLHIGTVRTALYNFLFAKKHGGTFIVRVEDTDTTRSTKAFEEDILNGLARLNLTHDALYRQSERKEIYARHLAKLVDDKAAYISKEPSKQDPAVMIEVVRLKNPNTVITFTDEVRGDIRFDTTELGDMVIARSMDDALYHFAVVVDDADMQVTHVIRGEDHISNTPRQILIQEALGFSRPTYAHLPLILAPNRSKLSKRHGAVSLNSYLDEGFLQDALINYLALLGWNPGTEQEVFTLPELVAAFDISGIQKGSAIFSREKLTWFNREHIQLLSDDVFKKLVKERLPQSILKKPQYSEERFSRLLPVIRERVAVLGDITNDAEAGEYDFAFSAPVVDKELIKWKNDNRVEDVLPRLDHVATLLKDLQEHETPESVKEALWPYAEEVGKGEVLWPLRVALSGKERSPDPFTIISIIGTKEALDRIENARATIEG